MAEAPIRIALLARAGEAREQLRRALTELGADLVAEGDPKEVDPDALFRLKPKVVLISLDPADEDSLDRFDAVLSAEGVEVMLDDAEVTRKLEGWDLARWARHLAAKLLGRDLLPPAPSGAEALGETDFTPVPGLPPTPAELMAGARLEDYAAEASGLMDDVPTTPSLTDIELPAVAAVDEASAGADELGLDVDLSMLEQAMAAPMVTANAEDLPTEEVLPPSLDFDESLAAPRSFGELASNAEPEPGFSLDIDLEGLERSLAAGGVSTAAEPEAGADELSLGSGSGLLIDVDFDSDKPVSFAAYSQDDEGAAGVMDDAVAALAAQLDAQVEAAPALPDLELPPDRSPSGAEAMDGRERPPALPEPPAPEGLPELGGLALPDLDLPTPSKAASVTPEPPASSFGSLELSLLDEPGLPPAAPVPSRLAPAAAPEAPVAKPASLFAGMSLSLEGEEPAAPAVAPVTPAVAAVALVLAGLGGPDAVRQLLAGLPVTMPVPVLLYQHLENGKYDRLAEQLAKASRLPVVLGKPDLNLRPGSLTVLQAGLGLVEDGPGFRFIANSTLAALIKRLPAGSAILVLSGADAGLLPDLVVANRHGTRLFAQSPDSCFDATAAEAAIAAGASAASAAELAQQLAARWPS